VNKERPCSIDAGMKSPCDPYFLITIKHERRFTKDVRACRVLIVETPCQLSTELLIYLGREPLIHTLQSESWISTFQMRSTHLYPIWSRLFWAIVEDSLRRIEEFFINYTKMNSITMRWPHFANFRNIVSIIGLFFNFSILTHRMLERI